MKQQGKKRKGGAVKPSDKRRKHPNSSAESFGESPSKTSVDVDPQHGQEDVLSSTNGSDFNPDFGLRNRSSNSSVSEYENKENQKQLKDDGKKSGNPKVSIKPKKPNHLQSFIAWIISHILLERDFMWGIVEIMYLQM